MKTAKKILEETITRYGLTVWEAHTDKMNRMIAMEAMERYAEQKAKEFSKWFSGDNKVVNFDFDKLYKEFENETLTK